MDDYYQENMRYAQMVWNCITHIYYGVFCVCGASFRAFVHLRIVYTIYNWHNFMRSHLLYICMYAYYSHNEYLSTGLNVYAPLPQHPNTKAFKPNKMRKWEGDYKIKRDIKRFQISSSFLFPWIKIIQCYEKKVAWKWTNIAKKRTEIDDIIFRQTALFSKTLTTVLVKRRRQVKRRGKEKRPKKHHNIKAYLFATPKRGQKNWNRYK